MVGKNNEYEPNSPITKAVVILLTTPSIITPIIIDILYIAFIIIAHTVWDAPLYDILPGLIVVLASFYPIRQVHHRKNQAEKRDDIHFESTTIDKHLSQNQHHNPTNEEKQPLKHVNSTNENILKDGSIDNHINHLPKEGQLMNSKIGRSSVNLSIHNDNDTQHEDNENIHIINGMKNMTNANIINNAHDTTSANAFNTTQDNNFTNVENNTMQEHHKMSNISNNNSSSTTSSVITPTVQILMDDVIPTRPHILQHTRSSQSQSHYFADNMNDNNDDKMIIKQLQERIEELENEKNRMINQLHDIVKEINNAEYVNNMNHNDTVEQLTFEQSCNMIQDVCSKFVMMKSERDSYKQVNCKLQNEVNLFKKKIYN